MCASATKMKNQFLEKPTADNIKEIGESFCLRDAVVAIDGNDVNAVMANAEECCSQHIHGNVSKCYRMEMGLAEKSDILDMRIVIIASNLRKISHLVQ